MINLNGILSAVDMERLRTLTNIRVIDPNAYQCPESIIAYEQNMISDADLFKICQDAYGIKIEVPKMEYIQKNIIAFFEGKNCVPFRVDSTQSTIHVMVLPENKLENIPSFSFYKIQKHLVPIYHYVNSYIPLYGKPDFIGEIPAKDLWEFIVAEAVKLGASDITISRSSTKSLIYYDVRKKKVHSKRAITLQELSSIITYITIGSNAVSPVEDARPKRMSMDLDEHHRGRIVVNTNYYGKMVTIRVLSNDTFETSLEDLHLSASTRDFIRKYLISLEPGLHLLIGPTSGGKNTTIISAFRELMMGDKYKCVSIEMPVEIVVDNLEQINTETEEDYCLNIESLLRQNPQVIYLSEMTDTTALKIVEVSNTSKPVFTTIHASSIADVITRLVDLTKLSPDRVIMSLQSCIYQTLERNEEEDAIFPKTKCMYFSQDLKKKLFGKSLAEIYLILYEEEKKWC